MKKFLLFLLGLIVLAIIAAVIFLMTFDLNSYREYITEKVSETLGRPVTIGHMELKMSMIPTVKINNIKIANPEKFSEEDPLISIDSAEATMAIAPLFSKRIEVQEVKAGTIHLNLIQQGARNNWTIEVGKKQAQPKQEAKKESEWQTRVDSISAKNVTVAYKNGDKNYKLDVSDFSFKQLTVLSLTVVWNEMPFKITARVDDVLKFMKKEPDYVFNIEVVGIGSTVKLEGSIGDTTTFKKLLLNAEISGTSLKQTLEELGIRNAAIPAQPFVLSTVLQGDLSKFDLTKLNLSLGGNKLKANFTGTLDSLTRQPEIGMKGKIVLADWTLGQVWGIQPFNADLEFDLTKTEVVLKKFLYQAGRSDVQLAGKVVLGKTRPDIALNIYSEYFNLQDMLQTKEAAYQAPTTAQKKKNISIPNIPVPLNFLKSFDGVFSVSMPHLQVTDQIVGYLGKNGVVSVKDGVLTTNGFRFSILGGDIVANMVADSNNGQKFALKMTGSNFDLNNVKTLNDVVKDAVMDFSVDVTAVGDTTHKIISSLNGNLEVEIPQGVIIDQFFNNDIVEVLGGRKKRSVSYSTADQVNELLCGVVKVKIQNGEIKAQNNIALETPHVGFMIGGDIRLTDLWVSLSLKPVLYQVKQTAADKILNAARRSVRVIGNIPNVKFEADTTEAIKGFLEQETFKPYQACTKVLGRKSKGQSRTEAKKLQMLPEPVAAEEPEKKPKTTKEQLKQQLLESLTQALQ